MTAEDSNNPRILISPPRIPSCKRNNKPVSSNCALEERWSGVSGTITSTLRFKFRFRIWLILSAREDKRTKAEGKYPCRQPCLFFILKIVILIPKVYIFFWICFRALAWTLVCKIYMVGRLPIEMGSHFKGCREKVDHSLSETLIVIYGWDADVSKKWQGSCWQTKPNL